jgi:ABC-2 type transport system ATP-binding protein
MTEYSLELDHVSFEYQEGVGVYDLCLELPKGVIFGLIGPSGCGKTTTVRLTLGILKPDMGVARIGDESSRRLSAAARLELGYMPQHFVLYPRLTVLENLNFVASIYGMSLLKRKKLIADLLDIVDLEEVRNRLAMHLSGGMQKRLALAAALLHQPTLVFADEPTSGIDPILRNRVWDFIHAYRDRGNSLFVTTQYVAEAAYCDLIGVMNAGRLISVDTPENLRRKALGGEIIYLQVDPQMHTKVLDLLRQHPEVHKIETVDDQDGSFHIYVERSGDIIPQLIQWLGREPDIEIRSLDRYEPPFDQIFPLLISTREEEAR